jgi:hypothetical protein
MINDPRTVRGVLAALALAVPNVALAAAEDDAPALPDLAPIQAQVAAIRGLEFKQDVPAEEQSLEDFAAFVDGELKKAFPPERQEGMMAGLMLLGLIDEPIDIGESFRTAVLTQAGAHYDPKTKKFYYLMTGLPAEALQVIASHELVHALQDQHFDLTKVLGDLELAYLSYPRNDDQLLAVRSLVEGEATYIMTVWQLKTMMGQDITANPQFETMVFKQQADMSLDQIVQLTKMQIGAFGGEDSPIGKAMTAMEDIPPLILEPLYAAYMKGAYFAMRLRQEGGWERISKAFEEMPESTEQILHPEKLTTEIDRPTRMTFPDGFLGDDWKPLDSAVLGEFYVDMLLRQQGVERATAQKASAGWDGDVYAAYRHADGRQLMIFVTTWDTEGDAAEFYDAYRSILKRKHPEMKPDEGEAPEALEGVAADLRYQIGGEKLGSGRLLRRGREVFAIEGGTRIYNEQITDALIARPIDRVD